MPHEASILLLAALLVPILGLSAPAGEDATRGPDRAQAVADVRRALESEDPKLVAHAGYQVGRLGLWELQGPMIAHLVAAARRDEATRNWPLVQILLEALLQVRAEPPVETALLPHLARHRETVVAILVRERAVYADALLGLQASLDGEDEWLPWIAVGGALAERWPRRFVPFLLDEIEVVFRVAVHSPWRPGDGVSGPSPPPVVRTWEEVRQVPEGYPPVQVSRIVRADVPSAGMPAGVGLRTEEHVAGTLRIGGTRVVRGEDGTDPSWTLRWLDRCLRGEGARNLPPLRAASRASIVYTGPTPWRDWLRPQHERLHAAWFARLRALVDEDFMTAEEAARTASPVRIDIRDGRRCRRPFLLPLDVVPVRNPFAPRPVLDDGSM